MVRRLPHLLVAAPAAGHQLSAGPTHSPGRRERAVLVVHAAFLLACLAFLSAGCAYQDQGERDAAQTTLFELLPPERTGIDFSNLLSERPTPHRNELLYEYFSNGGGVAVGDLNGDGLDDIYFTGNMTYNRLYLNRGDLEFEDVTEISGVGGRKDTWNTGAAMADVNGDSLLDIYVCYSGNLPLERRIDELYVNQGPDENGIPQFEEQAHAYGLANPHSSNQAYFLDYDRDNDLDLFLLTHNVERTPRLDSEGTREQLAEEDPISGVRLYRNDDGRFHDVTTDAGIQSSALTYGLGAAISDLNKDGWPDMYVGNDYSPPDYLYINNGDGTFTDELGVRMGHTSNASMGIDAADMDNDGWPDIVVLDMLAADNKRQKTLFVPDDRSLFKSFVDAGFHHQYMRNTLQLNNRDGTFSEIGQLAGISNTDWSWTPLFADYDNDGRKDLFISNGILHDTIDKDFLLYKNRYMINKRYNLEPGDIAYLMERLPSSDLRNYAFRNSGGLRFEDASSDWGLGHALKTTGAAYSDLDNDGDLDLITNNINDAAYVFENRSTDVRENNYLRVDLRGAGDNTAGIGAKVTLYAGGQQQYIEQMPARGYLSSVSPTLHFGLGLQATIDSVSVTWPDGKKQSVKDVEANRRIVVDQQDAGEVDERRGTAVPVFEEAASEIDFEHRMTGDIDDFLRQPLMVHPKSFTGPVLVTADVNGDGLDDVFAGGGNDQAGTIYLQDRNGQFAATRQPALEADRRSHDGDAAFFDANGDGYLDLYVASGGYGTFAPDDEALQDRLYFNDGQGTFNKSSDALPEMLTSASKVAVADLNGDRSPDLFVGGYVIPGQYPAPPRSYVLVNDGRGRFEDGTDEIAPELRQIGMVSDAVWHDLNGDDTNELIIVGSWMPITIFEHIDGMLTDNTESYFRKRYSGIWNTLLVDDVNEDGRPDIIAGNLGLNSQLQASEDRPAELHYADFNHDGSIDPILTFYIQGTSYPYVTLDELRDEMRHIAARFSSHAEYSEAKLEDIFTDRELDRSRKLKAGFLATSLFIGTEGGIFEEARLPVEAQFSPVFAAHTLDYNNDGHVDLLLGGNASEARIRFGKYDANYGMLFRGNGTGSFEYIPQNESGFSVWGDVRSILQVNNTLFFGVNRSSIRAYRLVAR